MVSVGYIEDNEMELMVNRVADVTEDGLVFFFLQPPAIDRTVMAGNDGGNISSFTGTFQYLFNG